MSHLERHLQVGRWHERGRGPGYRRMWAGLVSLSCPAELGQGGGRHSTIGGRGLALCLGCGRWRLSDGHIFLSTSSPGRGACLIGDPKIKHAAMWVGPSRSRGAGRATTNGPGSGLAVSCSGRSVGLGRCFGFLRTRQNQRALCRTSMPPRCHLHSTVEAFLRRRTRGRGRDCDSLGPLHLPVW